MTTHVITDSIKAELEAWRGAFIKRWETQPPEFFTMCGMRYEDHYSSNISDMINPIRTEWFQQLVREATLADLDAIERHLGGESISYRAYQCFFQSELVMAAKKAHDEKRPYSEEIPLWFRFKDWNIGPKWKCEERRDKALWASLGFPDQAEAAAPAPPSGGAGSAAVEDLTWQCPLRDKLQVARDAIREAEALLEAHMLMRR